MPRAEFALTLPGIMFHHACLLYLLHFIYTIYLKLVSFFTNFWRADAFDVLDYKTLKQISASFQKIPQHIMIHVDEQWCIGDVGRVVALASALAVKEVTFYNPPGTLSRKMKQLVPTVTASVKDFFAHHQALELEDEGFVEKEVPLPPRIQIIHVGEHIQMISPPCASSRRPCECDSDIDIVVNMTDADAGRKKLVNISRRLGQDAGLASDNLSVSQIDQILLAETFSEPNVLIVFGDTVQLQNTPPWQMRLTEMQLVCRKKRTSESGITDAEFIGAIRRFSECSQRFGK